jgi:hypothetical protein
MSVVVTFFSSNMEITKQQIASQGRLTSVIPNDVLQTRRSINRRPSCRHEKNGGNPATVDEQLVALSVTKYDGTCETSDVHSQRRTVQCTTSIGTTATLFADIPVSASTTSNSALSRKIQSPNTKCKVCHVAIYGQAKCGDYRKKGSEIELKNHKVYDMLAAKKIFSRALN